MTATFWTGSSLSFTNGSKTVTVNTGPSLAAIKPNSSLKAGSYNEPVEIESVSGSTITLFNNWPGSTGTTSATITPSAATVASAGVAAQQVITEIQNLVGSASATATANSFVKRDSGGRVKTATPSANDDAVNKGYLGSAATKDVGTSSGQLMQVGAFGLTEIPSLISSRTGQSDFNSATSFGFYTAGGAEVNAPFSGAFGVLCVKKYSDSIIKQEFSAIKGAGDSVREYSRQLRTGVWSEWQENYHSGNTNFNEFGVFGSRTRSLLSIGYGTSTSEIEFVFSLQNTERPTSISLQGDFIVRSIGDTATISSSPTLSLSTRSTGKLAIVTCSGLSGIVEGKAYKLMSNSSTTRITFNF